MSRRLKIGLAVFVVLTAAAVVVPLKLLRGRVVEVDAEKAKRTDIEETVSAVPVAGQPAGTVKPEDVKVIPRVGGELTTLLVEEGDYVTQGQVVAYLDPRPLNADLTQARAVASAAHARAAEAQADLAAVPVRAQTAVDEAKAAVEQAASVYRTALRGAREQEIERAVQAVAQAEEDLKDTQATLATTERGARPEEIAAADAALKQAEAAADAAQAQYDLLKAGPRTEDVAQARAALDEAEANLKLKRAELDSQKKLAEGGWISRNALETAQTAHDAARASRSSAEQRLALAAQPHRPEDLTRAEAALRQAQAQADQARHNLDLIRRQTTPEQLTSARARRDAATARVKAAQADLDLARHQTTPEDLDSAGAAVRARKAAARRAEAERVSVRQRQLQTQALRADARRAEAALEQAAERAGYTTIRAPIGGLVTQVNVKEGEYVRGGEVALPTAEMSMLVVTNTRGIWVEANVDEADIGKVRPDQPATITLRDSSTVTARVHHISPSIRLTQGDVRTFAVKLAVDRPTEKLRSGMSVDVDIVVRAQKNCLSVPGFALFEDKKGDGFVYVIENGTAQKRKIAKGAEGIERVEVTSGVKEGDLIITSLEEKGLRDGAKVKVRPETETPAGGTDKAAGSETAEADRKSP